MATDCKMAVRVLSLSADDANCPSAWYEERQRKTIFQDIISCHICCGNKTGWTLWHELKKKRAEFANLSLAFLPLHPSLMINNIVLRERDAETRPLSRYPTPTHKKGELCFLRGMIIKRLIALNRCWEMCFEEVANSHQGSWNRKRAKMNLLLSMFSDPLPSYW